MERYLQAGEALGRRLMQRLSPARLFGGAALPPQARVIAVASGKGGTGKSFFATNFAVALHRLGRRVAVVDCDFGLGNAHLLFGVNPKLSMYHLLAGLAQVGEVLETTSHGPALVAGGSGISSLAELDDRHFELLAAGLAQLAPGHDALLLDCAAGLSPASLLTILLADHLLLVTNPEIAALTDAYALIKCVAKQTRIPSIHVVVNRVVEPGQGWPTFERLAEVARRFVGVSLHYVGEIAENPAVSHRRLGQAPLIVSHPECAEARAVIAAVSALEAAVGPIVAGSHGDAVERRMRRLRDAR